MAHNLEDARRALGGAYDHSKQLADEEFASFLESLEEMRGRLAKIGITFDALDANQVLVEFKTSVGPVNMTKLTVLEEHRVSYAMVFSTPTDADGVREPDLWSLHLRCHTPWVHADGTEVRRDMRTDIADPFSVLEAVRSAAAAKLLRNTERIQKV